MGISESGNGWRSFWMGFLHEVVVVIALTAEGISTALRTAVGTDRRSAVTALRHGGLAARRPDIAVT